MKEIDVTPEQKQDALREIREFFWNHRDEEISDFHASLFLQFVLDKIAPTVYNRAIADAHKLMVDRIEDLFALEKRPR